MSVSKPPVRLILSGTPTAASFEHLDSLPLERHALPAGCYYYDVYGVSKFGDFRPYKPNSTYYKQWAKKGDVEETPDPATGNPRRLHEWPESHGTHYVEINTLEDLVQLAGLYRVIFDPAPVYDPEGNMYYTFEFYDDWKE